MCKCNDEGHWLLEIKMSRLCRAQTAELEWMNKYVEGRKRRRWLSGVHLAYLTPRQGISNILLSLSNKITLSHNPKEIMKRKTYTHTYRKPTVT